MDEKEAIKILNRRINQLRLKFAITNEDLEAIGTLLNLLEKKDKEISKLKNNNKELLRKLRNRVKEVKKLTKYSLYKKEFSTLNKQVKKKDKMIDEMANKLVEAHGWFYSEFDNYTKEDFKQYFENKVNSSEQN